MFKSKSWREIKPAQGVTRTGSNKTAAQARLQATAPAQGKWRKSALPKGGAKTKDIIGSMRTGR
jgi:hypothetical protein